jgi:hypothetical protein
MSGKAVALIAVLLLLAVTAGCGRFERYPPDSEEVNIYYEGSIKATDDGFQMNGTYYVDSPGNPSITEFNDTVVYLYSENGEQLATERLGPFDGSVDVELSANATPKYVILDSPDFWGDHPVSVNYFVRKESSYVVESVTARDQLPLRPPNSSETRSV